MCRWCVLCRSSEKSLKGIDLTAQIDALYIKAGVIAVNVVRGEPFRTDVPVDSICVSWMPCNGGLPYVFLAVSVRSHIEYCMAIAVPSVFLA